MKHYDTLFVSPNASQEEIRKAFKKLALQWHPDKNPTKTEEAKRKFQEINEAFEILGNEQKRKEYDHEYLRKRSYEDAFFHDSQEFFFGFAPRFHSPMFKHPFQQFTTTHRRVVHVTLEDLHTKAHKKFKITHNGPQGKPVERDIEVQVQPGWANGKEIILQSENLVLTFQMKPHKTFQRKGFDLYTVLNISLPEALTGVRKVITDLDNRKIDVITDDVVHPNHVIRLHKKGLAHMGDIVITFKINFPTKLTNKQKEDLLKVFSRE